MLMAWQASRLETNSDIVNQKLAEAQEAAVFIKEFVVQGVLNEEGNFGAPLDLPRLPDLVLFNYYVTMFCWRSMSAILDQVAL